MFKYILFTSILAIVASGQPLREPARVERLERAGGRGGASTSDFYNAFVFAPASGRGMDSPKPLCSILTPGERQGSWTCFEGNGSSTGVTLAKSGTDLDSTSYVCGGGDVLVPSRNPNSDAIWTNTTSRSPSNDYTTCALVKPGATSGEQALLTWSYSGTGAGLGLSPFVSGGGTTYGAYYSSGSTCNNVTGTAASAPLTPGANTLVCLRVSAARTTMDMFVNGVKQTITSSGVNVGCSDGSPYKYNINSWGGVSPQSNSTSILGAFATETALSDARIMELTRSTLGTYPTSVTGVPLVVTRGSSASETKGIDSTRTTGINNGDMVMCGAGQARQAKNSAGTLGVLIESGSSNYALRSSELDNAAWIPYQDGLVAVPTVTGNVAIAPDGTLSADQIALPSTSNVQSSLIYQGACLLNSECAISFYVKGVTGSGTIDVCAGNAGAACQPCSYNNTSWTRCTRTGVSTGAGNMFIGNAGVYNGGISRPAQSVLVWGAQAEQNTQVVSSYIPTTSSAVTRAGDLAQFDLGVGSTLSGASYSIAASSSGFDDTKSIQYSGYFQVAINAFADLGSGVWGYQNNMIAQTCLLGNSSNIYVNSGGQALSSSLGIKRQACWGNSNTQGTYVGLPLSVNGPVTGTLGPLRYFNLGNTGGVATYIRSGIYTNICLDSNPSLCR